MNTRNMQFEKIADAYISNRRKGNKIVSVMLEWDNAEIYFNFEVDAMMRIAKGYICPEYSKQEILKYFNKEFTEERMYELCSETIVVLKDESYNAIKNVLKIIQHNEAIYIPIKEKIT